MIVRGILQNPVAIPLNAVPIDGFTIPPLPVAFWLDQTLRVHGMAFNDPSGNAA